MSQFNKSEWVNEDTVKEFVTNADNYILERRRMLNIAKSYFKFFLTSKPGKTIKVLDLGCGDGAIIHELLLINPQLEGTLVDGSPEMLEAARKRLSNYGNLKFIHCTFQEMSNKNTQIIEDYDFVISSLAIHHLDLREKKVLFDFIFKSLNDGGAFLNIDVILPPNNLLEDWYLALWQEWIQEINVENAKRFLPVPEQYRGNPDNLPDLLDDQLNILKEIGFNDVDCYFKYGIFAVFGGRKFI